LRRVVEVFVPALRFVRGLHRFDDLVVDEQAELEADVVSREHVLAGDEQRRLAEVERGEREVAAPANMVADAENLDELALVIKQAGVAFRHEVRMANAWQLEGRDDGEYEQDYNAKCEEHIIHR